MCTMHQTMLVSPITLGYHLELRVAKTFYWDQFIYQVRYPLFLDVHTILVIDVIWVKNDIISMEL